LYLLNFTSFQGIFGASQLSISIILHSFHFI